VKGGATRAPAKPGARATAALAIVTAGLAGAPAAFGGANAGAGSNRDQLPAEIASTEAVA
jgi:hypothetical protein